MSSLLSGNSGWNNRERESPHLPTRMVRWEQNSRTTDTSRQHRTADMEFSGTWKVYSEENLEQFLEAVGAPQMVVKMRKEMKPAITIEQKGRDFTFTMKTPLCTKVHQFSLGKETDITTVDGRKFKCIVREENGKLITEADKFTSVREIQGEDMVETVTSGSVTFISRSKRV